MCNCRPFAINFYLWCRVTLCPDLSVYMHTDKQIYVGVVYLSLDFSVTYEVPFCVEIVSSYLTLCSLLLSLALL